MTVALLALLLTSPRAHADIYRVDNNQVIPGTTGITPGPGIDLSNWNTLDHQLEDANLQSIDLSGASFATSDLAYAAFSGSTCINVNLTGANLANAAFDYSNVTGVLFAGATVQGTSFLHATGLTFTQIASTGSYQNKNLSGVGLMGMDLSGCDFSNQNLTNSSVISSTLSGTIFTGALVQGTYFSADTGLTFAQIESTASYQQKNLTGILFNDMDLHIWNFSSQNLNFALLYNSNLTQANFTNANLTNANLSMSTLNHANLRNADLTGATLEATDFSDANLSNAKLANTSFAGAIPGGGGGRGGTGIQAHSTLSRANLSNADLSNAHMPNTIMTNANLSGANLTNTNLIKADLTCADLRGAIGWAPDASTITSNTIRPDGVIQGLALSGSQRLFIRNNPMAITVNNSAAFDPTSTLEFLVESDWTSVIQFGAGVTPSLGGTLDLELADGVDPSNLLGRTFHLFAWNSALAPANQFVDITTEAGLNWDTSNLYANGTVTLTAIPEPATLVLLGAAFAVLLCPCRKRSRRKAIYP